jgi:hypothetical protein
MDVPSRGPGYPIWLILTGLAPLDTWWGLVASQVAMAAAAPVLVYGIVVPVSRNAGFVAGLLFMLFGISYFHMNWVMTEELFLFMELLSLLFVARYLCAAWVPSSHRETGVGRWTQRARASVIAWLRTPYPIALLLAYTTMVKPAAAPFFWLFILVCLLFRVEPWKRYIGPVVVYAAIMTGWGTFDYHYSPVRFSPFGMPHTQVQRNFADLYYGLGFGAVNGWTPVTAAEREAERLRRERGETAAPMKPDMPAPVGAIAPQAPTIRPESGPASQKLYQAVAAFIESQRRSGQWNVTDPDSIYQLYGRYGSTSELTGAIFVRPNPFYYQIVVAAASMAGGDELLGAVAHEHGKGRAAAYLNYLLRHPTVPLMGPPNPYVGFMYFMKLYRYRDYLRTNEVGPRNLFLGSYDQNMVVESNGPAAQTYARSIRFFIDALPQFVFSEALTDFATADALKAYAIENPYYSKYSGSMMAHIYQWMHILYGEQSTGRLLGAAGLEATFRNSAAYGMVFGDYLSALAHGPPVPRLFRDFKAGVATWRSMSNTGLDLAVANARQTALPPNLAMYVGTFRERSDFSRDAAGALGISYAYFKGLKPVLFGLMVVLALPLLLAGGGVARLTALLLLAYFVSAAAFTAVMIMPQSDPRHEEVYAFMPLIVAVLGFAHLATVIGRGLSQRRQAIGHATARGGPAASS